MVTIVGIYSDLRDSYERLADKSGIEPHQVEFPGFDGNNEAELMSIARFLVEKMSRFSRFKGRDFNSHSPSAVRQRRMVAAFEPIRATLDLGRQLSASQIIEILEAGRA